MSDYTICAITDVPDIFEGQYPGAMRFLTDHLEAQQIALTHRLMPPRSGGKGSHGHRHKTQEEIYYVLAGTLQFKLDDQIIDVPSGDRHPRRTRRRSIDLERRPRRCRARDLLHTAGRPTRRRRTHRRLLANQRTGNISTLVDATAHPRPRNHGRPRPASGLGRASCHPQRETRSARNSGTAAAAVDILAGERLGVDDRQVPDQSERRSRFHVGAILGVGAEETLEFAPWRKCQAPRSGARRRPDRDGPVITCVSQWRCSANPHVDEEAVTDVTPGRPQTATDRLRWYARATQSLALAEPLCPRDEVIAPCCRARPWLVLAAGGHDPAGLHD